MAAALTVAATLFSGCHSVDDDRIPPLPVYLAFTTVGMWDTYGVAGATSHRRFILTERLRVPENFPFTALSQTGYGGILLVSDILGDPQAYDLACPVEVRQDVRIRVDSEKCRRMSRVWLDIRHILELRHAIERAGRRKGVGEGYITSAAVGNRLYGCYLLKIRQVKPV